MKELTELVEDEGGQANMAMQEELKERVADACEGVKKVEATIRKKTAHLRTNDLRSFQFLESLKKNKWINLQLNVRVLCDQLITKLRARKFELASLERAHTSRILDEQTRGHVEKAVKDCAPSIQATLRKYNENVQEMVKERSKSKAVRKDAYIPPLLSTGGCIRWMWIKIFGKMPLVGTWRSSKRERYHLGLVMRLCRWLFGWLSRRSIVSRTYCGARPNTRTCRCGLQRSTTPLGGHMKMSLGTECSLKHFILWRLHHLHDLFDCWQHDIYDVPSVNDSKWISVHDTLPSLHAPQSSPASMEQEMQDVVDLEMVEGSVVSSEDDEEEEVEDVHEPQDPGLLSMLDRTAGQVGDDEPNPALD